MSEESAEALFELFIRQANHLAESRHLKSGGMLGMTLGVPDGASSVRCDTGEDSITVEFQLQSGASPEQILADCLKVRLPDEEALESFLVRLRKFVAKGETLNLDRVYNKAEVRVRSGLTAAALRKSRERYREARRRYEPVRLVGVRRLDPPQRAVVDLWMQGHIFHDNPDKRVELGLDALPEPQRSAAIFQFVQFARKVAGEVMIVRNLLRRALRLRLVK